MFIFLFVYLGSDSLTLGLLFEDCLTDKFKYLINEIATFYNYKQPINKEVYFVERTGMDGKAKGKRIQNKASVNLFVKFCSNPLF